jgi:hypothetical protein
MIVIDAVSALRFCDLEDDFDEKLSAKYFLNSCIRFTEDGHVQSFGMF